MKTNKKRRLALILCVVLVMGGWLARVVWLNATTPFAEKVVYKMGERVEYGEDYYATEREIRREYAVTVKGATLRPLQEYLELYGLEKKSDDGTVFWPDYVMDVTVVFERAESDGADENAVDVGIDLFQSLLTNQNLRMPVKNELFWQQYPQLDHQFGMSLRPGTSMEFHLPYAPETAGDQTVADEAYLRRNTFYLNLSLYPHKKRIEVKAS